MVLQYRYYISLIKLIELRVLILGGNISRLSLAHICKPMRLDVGEDYIIEVFLLFQTESSNLYGRGN